MSLKEKFNKIKKVAVLKVIVFSITLFLISTVLSVLLLRFFPVPISAIMIQDKLNALNSEDPFEIRQTWAPYKEISKNIKIAVIAAEDQKFPDHWGFDIESMSESIEKSKKGKKLRGASTITQQTAKNLFCWKGRSFIRKGLEAYYTLLIEMFWSKERILEVYLNIIELGKGIYGVEAASKIYFSKKSSKLSINESALLSAVLPSPRKRSVTNPSPYLYNRTFWILEQVKHLGGFSYLKSIED